jgi:hypothetical protein
MWRKQRVLNAVRRPLIGIAAIPLAVLVLTQVALSTPLFLRIFNTAFAGDVVLDYDSAWSFWPGHVYVRGLSLRGEDANVQWLLRIERTSTTFALRELLHRTFHATRSRSSGVSFVARMKMPRADATPEHLFGKVQIAGFDPLPLMTEGPDELDLEENYRLWTVHLDDSLAEVRELWFERFHVIGSALVTGGFFLKPVRRAQVEGQLQARSLELKIGDDLVARDLRGHLALSLEAFDPRTLHSRGVLGQVSAQVDLSGQLAGLGFLQRMLPPGIRVEAAPGPVLLELLVDHGSVAAGSTLDVSSPRMSVELWRLRAEGGAAIAVRVPGASGSLSVEMPSLSVAPIGASRPPMHVQRARLEVKSDRLDLTTPLYWRSFVADLEGGALPDLRIIQALLPQDSGLLIESGQASLSGQMAGTPNAAHGHIDFAVHQATASASRERLRASVKGEARISVDGLGALSFSGSEVSIDHVNLLRASNAPDWWGRFQVPSAQVDAGAGTVLLKMTGECRDARPLAGFLSAHGVPGFVRGAFSMDGLRMSGTVRVAPDEIALLDLRAVGKSAWVRANYRSRGQAKRGAALVSTHGITTGINLNDGNVNLVPFNPGSWYEHRLGDKDLLAQSRR